MKTLIEWCSENGKIPYALGVKGAYEAGQESRQTEVDGLQKQLIDQGQRFNDQSQHVKDLEHKNGELQKRVDELKQENILLENGQKSLFKQHVGMQKRVDAFDRIIKKWSKDAKYADQIAQEDFVQNTLQGCIDELEQALKGGGE